MFKGVLIESLFFDNPFAAFAWKIVVVYAL